MSWGQLENSSCAPSPEYGREEPGASPSSEAIQSHQLSCPVSCSSGWPCHRPLPLPSRGEQNQNQSPKHKAKVGLPCSRPARGQEAGAGSQSSPSSLSRARGALRGLPWPWDKAEGTHRAPPGCLESRARTFPRPREDRQRAGSLSPVGRFFS